MAERITSPFGNSAENLPEPVPGAGVEPIGAVDPSQIAGAGITVPAVEAEGQTLEQAPGMPQAPAEAQDLDALFSTWDTEEAEQSGALDPTTEGEQTQPGALPQGPEGIASLKEQWRESGMRLRKAFAVTSPENKQVIEESGLFDGVRETEDGWEVKRKGAKKFTPLDREGYQLITDTLDFARDAFEAVIEGGTEVAGTVAGVAGGGVVGGLPANLAAGAGGAVLAKTAGDAMAQEVFSIERDPERNLKTEFGIAAAFGAGFGWFGSKMARSAATKKFTQVADDKSMQGTMETVAETIGDINEVKSSGLGLTEDGFQMDPNMLTGGENKELAATASYVSDTSGYRNFVKETGDSLVRAYDSLTDQVKRFAGKNTDNLGKDFVIGAKDIKKAEGALIGDFIQHADKATRGKAKPTPRTFQTLQSFGEELGDKNGRITVESAIQNFGLDEGKAKMLVAKINKARAMSKKGQMSVDTSKVLYDDLTRTINRMNPAEFSSPHGRALIELKNAVRDDWVDLVDDAMPDMIKGQFQASRQRYASLMDASRSLNTLLKSEDLSRDVLVKRLFEGTKSKELMTNAKTLIQETNPELWTELTTEYFTSLKRNAIEEISDVAADGTKRVIRSVNWNGMAKKWKKLDPNVRKELAESSGFGQKGVDALFSLGQKYQNADVSFMARASQRRGLINGVKNAISFHLGGGAAKGTAAVSMLEGIGKDQALMKWLQDGNVEQIIRESTGLKRGKGRAFIEMIHNWKPRGVKVGEAIVKTGEAVSKVKKPVGQLIKTERRRATEKQVSE